MSFFADNRTRQRLALDALTGQEPPLKRLRSVLGPDPALGEVGLAPGSALGLGLGLGLGRPVSVSAHGSSLDARAWPLRAGLDPHMLTASGLPGSLGALGAPLASFAMPSSASGFIERNLSALGPSQVMALKDLGMLQANPVLSTASAGTQLLAPAGGGLFKTKLCRHFIENSCKFQELCKFAHSVEELKKLPDVGDVEGKALLERYKAKAEAEKQSAGQDASTAGGSVLKTKLCKHFIDGTCIFKEGCRFAHSIEELRNPPDESDEAEKALFKIYKARFSTPSDGDQQKSIQTPAHAVAATATKTMLCKQYIIDNCKLGDSCPFAHSLGELVSLPAEDDVAGKILLELYQSKKEVQKPQQSVALTAVAPAISRGAEKTIATDPQTTQKPESLSNLATEVKIDDKSVRFLKTRMCKHFLVGACKYNKNCTFAHAIEELQPPADGVKVNPALSSQSQPVQAAQQVDAQQNETLMANKDEKQGLIKTKPCRFFSEGTCRFGNACAFIHSDQLLGTSSSTLQGPTPGEIKPTYKTRLCNLWEKDKTCSFGSSCHFAHGTQELRQRTGPIAPVSNSMTYGALELEALARAQQLALPTSGPYSYNVTDTNWRPYRGPEEGIHGLGGAAALMNERILDGAAAEALHYRGLLGDYGHLEQAGSLASLSSLGGANVGLGANMFTNLPSWSTR